MIIIRTDAQSNRKALVGALSELFHEKPRVNAKMDLSHFG